MTFCVAWRSKDSAFLVADAAISRPTGKGPSSPKSTFGEQHRNECGVTVEEAALKLFRWKHLALTCAGDADSIREFVRLTDDWMARGIPSWPALILARREQNLELRWSFEAIAAGRLLGQVRLLRLDLRGGWHWVAHGYAVNLGSAGKKSRDFVNGAISDASRSDHGPTIQLASVLAACQSLTVHNDLMAEGVGGAFSGLIIDSDGSRWQPDLGYLLLNPPDMRGLDTDTSVGTRNSPYITCAVRDDVLFVSSPETAGTIAFISTKQAMSKERMESVVRNSYEKARSVRSECAFEFVSIVSKHWPQTALIQMHGKPVSADLKLALDVAGKEEKLTMLLSQRVGEIVRGERENPQHPKVYICLNDAP
jgi:hypothetical protein